VAVSAGMDAMVHTLESFVGINANAMTRMYAKEAFRLLYHALPSIMDEPGHLQKRLEIQLGAYYAAISLFNSSSGIAGGLSYPLGVYYKIPHGICGGMFAIPVVEYNVQHGYYEYSELYDLIEDKDSSLALKEKAEDFVKKMYALAEKLKIPNKLSEFKISKENYDHVMEIIRILQGAFDQNPIKLKVEDAGKILDRFF
jgi:alcohol dehydrogenase class IV